MSLVRDMGGGYPGGAGAPYETGITAPHDVSYSESAKQVQVTRVSLDPATGRVTFLGEVDVLELHETNMLNLEDLDLTLEIPRTRYAFPTVLDDKAKKDAGIYLDDVLMVAAYPYSKLIIDRSTFKKRNNSVRRLERQVSGVVQNLSSTDVDIIAPEVLSYIESRSYDGWETNKGRISAALYPTLHQSEIGERTRQFTVAHRSGKKATLAPGRVLGVTGDYEACYWKLYEAMTGLVDQTETGKLRLRDHRQGEKNRAPLFVADALRGMANEVMQWSIKQALAGPCNFAQWVRQYGPYADVLAKELYLRHYTRLDQTRFRASLTTDSY